MLGKAAVTGSHSVPYTEQILVCCPWDAITFSPAHHHMGGSWRTLSPFSLQELGGGLIVWPTQDHRAAGLIVVAER